MRPVYCINTWLPSRKPIFHSGCGLKNRKPFFINKSSVYGWNEYAHKSICIRTTKKDGTKMFYKVLDSILFNTYILYINNIDRLFIRKLLNMHLIMELIKEHLLSLSSKKEQIWAIPSFRTYESLSSVEKCICCLWMCNVVTWRMLSKCLSQFHYY